MAKKRKGARPTRKAAGPGRKKTARKAAPRGAAVGQKTGLEDPRKADFRPLKKLMRAHIARLESVKTPDEQMARRIANALAILRQARTDLTRECQPTMELPTS